MSVAQPEPNAAYLPFPVEDQNWANFDAFPSAPPKPAPLEIDPFVESVFPVPQTPPRMKPRPSEVQKSAAVAPAPAPIVVSSRKRCVFDGCTNDRFARGYCALHLSDLAASKTGDLSGPAPTPTSRSRAVNKLWVHDSKFDKEKSRAECFWRLIHNDDAHTIELVDQLWEGLRTVCINRKQVFRGAIDLGSWTLDATIGKDVKTNINCKLVVTPTLKGYEYELYVDDRPFEEAHSAFTAKLSSTSVIQRLEMGERQGGADAVDRVRAEQLRDSLYVRENWNQCTDEEKTAMAGVKSRVTWHFTISGVKHTVVLEYGSLSGKKKLLLDGRLVVEQKPSLLSTHKHRRWAHQFLVDGVECEVTAEKNKDAHHHSAASASSSPRPYVFHFNIDHVPFENCLLTETDLAGGDIALDSSLAAAARRSVVRATQRRNSVHAPLSSEEYEAALREENERDRQAAKAARHSGDDSDDDD